jgi:L-rhamnose isomerase
MNNPNYEHRVFAGSPCKLEDYSQIDLVDSINSSVLQSESIILQMQTQFETDHLKLSDEANVYTLEAIRKELLDIKTIVNWYFDKSKQGESHE